MGTEILWASLIIGATTAYVSYEETKAANERAKDAAINRNKALEDQYNAEETGIMSATERETSALAFEKHRKREAIVASMVGSGRAVGQGSALMLGKFTSEQYNLAAGNVAGDASYNLGRYHMATGAQQQASWDQYLGSKQNALISAIKGGAAGMSTTMSLGSGMKEHGGGGSIFKGKFWGFGEEEDG
jgi:hypothetical protein